MEIREVLAATPVSAKRLATTTSYPRLTIIWSILRAKGAEELIQEQSWFMSRPLSFASAEALFRILAPTLEGDVEHRYQKDADRACGKHAAKHRRADGPSTDLGSCRCRSAMTLRGSSSDPSAGPSFRSMLRRLTTSRTSTPRLRRLSCTAWVSCSRPITG
jgi:hypothetical protein